ncbi:hypothetical protein OK016_21315 [Vibrio chagasii]|nr:hypothetical protein [Vibrio chagasii]
MISANQFVIGDRNIIPWWAIGISVVCTYVSAMSFLGGPAWSYKEGLSVIAIHLNYPLVIFFIVAVFMLFSTTTVLLQFMNIKNDALVKPHVSLCL